jgi:tetratricopeptide (TPR) repeat protein
MTTSNLFAPTDNPSRPQSPHAILEDPIERLCLEALDLFKLLTRQYALFHIIFFIIGICELFAFILFFSFLTKTTIFAFSLAGLFLTGFAYFVLLFYFQARKPEQLLEVRSGFLKACQTHFSVQQGTVEYHLARSSAIDRLLTTLHRQEYTYYSLPSSFQTLAPLMQKFSVWTHWKDLHQMKELLLLMVIKEQIEIIKIQPLDLEAHAHLANTFVSLSRLYMDPRKSSPDEEHVWISPDYHSSAMLAKFKQASFRAIEEFKILDTYAPNTPWVHAQLATIYHHLELPQDEMREYEAILKIAPNEPEIMLRLGILYFEHGLSAQALRLYEQLKKTHQAQAHALIAYYDAALSDE